MDLSKHSWSYSQYSAAMLCLRKFKLIYVDKISSEAPLSPHLEFGNAIHMGIEAFLKGEDGIAYFEYYWATLENSGVAWEKDGWSVMQETGRIMLEKFERYHLKKFKPAHLEQRLYYKDYGGLDLEGTIDFLGDFDGVPSLIDWKTTAQPYIKERGEISLQLHLYAFLAKHVLGDEPKQLIYYPFIKYSASIQNPIVVPFDSERTDELLNNMRQNIINMARPDSLVPNLDDFPKNTNSCVQNQRICEFYNQCWRQRCVPTKK